MGRLYRRHRPREGNGEHQRHWNRPFESRGAMILPALFLSVPHALAAVYEVIMPRGAPSPCRKADESRSHGWGGGATDLPEVDVQLMFIPTGGEAH